MHNSTLCYITRGDEVLMLHRVKKKNDVNQDKWIGIGGKFENDETPDECRSICPDSHRFSSSPDGASAPHRPG